MRKERFMNKVGQVGQTRRIHLKGTIRCPSPDLIFLEFRPISSRFVPRLRRGLPESLACFSGAGGHAVVAPLLSGIPSDPDVILPIPG